MKKAFRWLHKALDWVVEFRFLPAWFQNFLFGTCTRVIEITSGLVMLGFAVVFALHGNEMLKEDLYEKFQHLHPDVLVAVLFIVSVSQLSAAVFQSSRSNIISGCLLIWASLIWFLIAGAFIAAYPPLSTGMTTYTVLAVVCALAGRNLIKRTQRVEEKKGGE